MQAKNRHVLDLSMRLLVLLARRRFLKEKWSDEAILGGFCRFFLRFGPDLWISCSPIDFARRVVFMQLFASLQLTCRFRYVTLRARVPGTGRCCLVARKTKRRAPVVFF